MCDKTNSNTETNNDSHEEAVYMPPLDVNCEIEENALEYANSNQEDCEEEPILPSAPAESAPFFGEIAGLTYWGFSQQGESHVKNGLPCQDRCKVVVSDTYRPVIIAAIADGVGSCALAHYGAAIATESSTSFLKEVFDKNDSEEFADKWVGDTLRAAMHFALQSVKEAAENMEQLEYSFQSTLTIAIYDGNTLYIAHAGDDGVVALTEEGEVELVTSRIKGDEASSVYPLQAGSSHWQVLKVDRYVNGFVMATDGVLDAFVRGEKEGNRIYYPFIQPAFETRQKKVDRVKKTMDFYYDYMSSQEYRASVTDDLTMVVVTNQQYANKKNMPVFDEEEWNAKTKEYKDRVNAALYLEKASVNVDGETDNKKIDFVKNEEYCTVCNVCGEKITQRSKFCPNCGIRLPEQIVYDKSVQEAKIKKEINIPVSVQRKNTSNQSDKKEKTYQKNADESIKQANRTNSKKKGYPISSKNNNTSWVKVLIIIIFIIIIVVIMGGCAIGSLLKLLLF